VNAVIAEKDVDTVFDAGVVAELAKLLKLPTNTDQVRFGQSIRVSVKSYFFEKNRVDLMKIPRGRGRPRDPAARILVQNLALTYLEVSGQRPPAWVRSQAAPEQPFLKFVRRVFERARITSGNVDSLINERKTQRKILELPETDPETDPPPVSMEETRLAFEKRYQSREPRREAAEKEKKQAAKAKKARAAARKAIDTR
jgi:hypothetical protein